MTEMLFYHLQRQPIERVLPTLLEKSLERGWRVVVQAGSEERIAALDTHLWSYADDSFLPHGAARDGDEALQPILLTVDDHNPNGAQVRFLLDGAPVPPDAAAYDRIVVMFDGDNDAELADARSRWTAAKAAGFEATYWQADESGRWVKRG